MTIHSIRDIVPKRMTQHPLPVVLPDAVFFTQSRKGMSTIVRRVLRVAGYPQSFQCRVVVIGRVIMDYKKEIIEMVEKCTNNHWIEVIYIFVKRLIG